MSTTGNFFQAQRCEEIARILKILSHPLRLRILALLLEEELTVGELAKRCECSQSLISQFLARMRIENLLKATKDRRYVHYEIHDARLKALMKTIARLYCPNGA